MEDLNKFIGSWDTEMNAFSQGFYVENAEQQQTERYSSPQTPSRDSDSHRMDRRDSKNQWSTCRSDGPNHNERSKYYHQGDGLSPLRSPINNEQQSRDSASRGNHRHSMQKRHINHSSGDRQDPVLTSKSSPNKRSRDHTDMTKTSPTELPYYLRRDSDEGTPVSKGLFYESDDSSRHRSRRRLSLPHEEESGTNLTLDSKDDEDRIIIERREKQLSYGKNTESYKLYVEKVPRSVRSENRRQHPRTPNKYRRCSRRNWDAQVKAWKIYLHEWASNAHSVDMTLPPTDSKDSTKPAPHAVEESHPSKDEQRPKPDAEDRTTEEESLSAQAAGGEDSDGDDSFLDEFELEIDHTEL